MLTLRRWLMPEKNLKGQQFLRLQYKSENRCEYNKLDLFIFKKVPTLFWKCTFNKCHRSEKLDPAPSLTKLFPKRRIITQQFDTLFKYL